MHKRLTRSEVPIEVTWQLEDMFSSTEVWDAELKALLKDVHTVTQYKGQLHQDSATLLACLEKLVVLKERISRAGAYGQLRYTEDSTSPVNQANHTKAKDVLAQLNAELSFFKSELLALPAGTIERYLDEQPELHVFGKFLRDNLATKAHQLSPETEAALAALGGVLNAPYSIYLKGKLSDMTFASVQDGEDNVRPVSFALYEGNYAMSSDTKLRREAYQSFSQTLHVYQNTFAETYANEVKKQVVLSRLRNYPSVTEMLLQDQDVTLDMYNNILDIIQTDLAPHMRRLMKLKQRVLGLEKMTFSDLKAPLDPAYSPHVSYEEACSLIEEALQVLGPEYTEVVQQAFTQRWVDYADNVGKSTGAFCSSPYGSHPYILISWANNMRGAFTLAHEVGHAGHFVLAHRNQNVLNARPSLYFIEAPSTMNEMLLAQHLLNKSDNPRMKRWVILQLLNTHYHNFVTHLLEGEMQRRVYDAAMKDEPITAKKLSALKGDILSSFWGDAVEIDEYASLTWMRQPHYYMQLYPYTYAAGLTASTAAASLIRDQGQPAVDRWLSALKAGGTLSPLELMKLAGVDMATEQPIKAAVQYVGSLVDELEKLY
ncbi:oligoendopeptidase F [Paenibacillus sp. 481]|uniref:oligoendopeptidase F n=1 Tax=Paenibacillus sp. 481 TaxID=2835869 RepID=UPI001E6066FE|nr:oligoendopeptidase F [Paenibacillus sp. 481]UHA73799.1 oligoendopeptidase F [Paenibacillus sp. 481]